MRLLDAWERVRSARCRRQSLQLGVVAYARGQPHPLVIVGAARPCQCVLLVLLGQVGNAACSPNKATFDAGRALDMRWLLGCSMPGAAGLAEALNCSPWIGLKPVTITPSRWTHASRRVERLPSHRNWFRRAAASGNAFRWNCAAQQTAFAPGLPMNRPIKNIFNAYKKFAPMCLYQR